MDNYEVMIKTIENIIDTEIPEKFYSVIRNLFKEIKLNKSHILINEGDTTDKTYILVSGLIRSYYIDSKGNDITQYFIEKGDIFGYTSFTIMKPSDVYIETLEDCILMEADGPDFIETLSHNNFALICWIKILERKLSSKPGL